MLLTTRDQGGSQAETQVLESPFAEAEPIRNEGAAIGFASAGESFSPFTPEAVGELEQGETDRLIAEALAELRDESFDEAVAFLAEETEAAVGDRFSDETAGNGTERERFAEMHLSSVQFEADRYLEALEAGLQGLDLNSLSPEQLEDKLDQFDPSTGELSPAGEEFIGGLVRKAKKAVKFVVKTAGSVAKIAMPLLGPVLNKLKGLIRPLLKRVLSIAIGRLPAPLRPAARALAGKINFEGEDEQDREEEGPTSPANLTDVEALTEGFDALLAETAVTGETETETEMEGEAEWSGEAADGRQLERLAEARGALIDTLSSADEDQVAPAVEQFVPALLGALKIGINLVGRPKVVNFLAGYLSKLIGRFVGPQLSGPLSNAIVDTGMRLISLEAEDEAGQGTAEAAPVALASVIEDTVRRLAENEDYIFENEELTELAISEAFSRAAASHLPPQFIRPDLRQAAALGGTFVRRRPRHPRSFSKYSRLPEIEITAQIADSIPTFGGATLGSALRASGVSFPLRARLHLYQASPGSTVSAIIRADRRSGISSGNMFHPLTRTAAGVLLREPAMGTAVPGRFLRSPRRLAAGQRIYALQPMGGTTPVPVGAAGRAALARMASSRTRVAVDRGRGHMSVAMFFSESDAQRCAQALRTGRGHGPLLQLLADAWRRADGSSPRSPLMREQGEESEEFTAGGARLRGNERRAILRRLRRWALPALAEWARHNHDAFARAAANPAPGVTVRLRISAIGGLIGNSPTRQPAAQPTIAISVVPGFERP